MTEIYSKKNKSLAPALMAILSDSLVDRAVVTYGKLRESDVGIAIDQQLRQQTKQADLRSNMRSDCQLLNNGLQSAILGLQNVTFNMS